MEIIKYNKRIIGKYIKEKIKQDKGSLTVEATIALVIYIMSIVSFVHLLMGVDISAHISGAMYKGVYEVSMNSTYQKGMEEYLEEGRIKKLMDSQYISKTPIISGLEGINILFSVTGKYMEDINIKSKYYVNIPFLSIAGKGYGMEQNIKCRLFTGDIENKSDKKFVYVTKSGKVYHRDVECTYLIIKKQRVGVLDIEDYRNINGSKYELCKECKYDEDNTEYVYITNYGTSYHKASTCSTITRTVRAIEISEINERKACNKCIGEGFLKKNEDSLQ